MHVSPRSLLTGFGLLAALTMGTTAVAAPIKTLPRRNLPKVQPKRLPAPNPSPVLTGLRSSVTVTPRQLHTGGVSMNVHRPVRLEATSNRVKMDSKTQLWIHFRGAANTAYDVDCRFSGSRSMLVMDYASNKFVRQQRAAPSGGRLHHKVFARDRSEDLKIYLQSSGDVDWSTCTVKPD